MSRAIRLSVRAADLVNRRGKALGVCLVHRTDGRPYPIHPKHLVAHPWHDKIEYPREEFPVELPPEGDEPDGPVMLIVLDTPRPGAIDAAGGLTLAVYERLNRWKREAVVRHPEDGTGLQVVARKRR